MVLTNMQDKESPTKKQCEKLWTEGCPLIPREKFQIKLIMDWTKEWFFGFTRMEDKIKIGDVVIRRKMFSNDMLSLRDYLLIRNKFIFTKMDTVFPEGVKHNGNSLFYANLH